MDYNYIKKNIYILSTICNKLNIDYNIYIETNKEFIINKIFNVLINKLKDKKIIYSNRIQNYSNTNNLKETDYIYYGQYNTTDKNVKNILMNLTNNKFKFGAISQKIIKKAWLQNKLLTYKYFSKIWLKEYDIGEIDYDELITNL